VQSALTRQGVVASELGEFYLVRLLENLLRPPEPFMARPLGVRYLEALQAPPAARRHLLQHVGDTALSVCGIFPESLERSLVGCDYYQALGRGAYGHLASLASGSRSDVSFAEVFEDLARRFPAFSAVLAEIAFERIFPDDVGIVGLYRRWRIAGSAARAARMIAAGVAPVAPSLTQH
jgi:hypothetical protein